VEFASSGSLVLDAREALDLWAIAAVLQVGFMSHFPTRLDRLCAYNFADMCGRWRLWVPVKQEVVF